MRKLILILFVVNVVCGHAQNRDLDIFADYCKLVRFVVSMEPDHSVIFDVITDRDSVNVDLSNFDNFVESVMASCEYIPLSEFTYNECFEMAFGESDHLFYIGYKTVNMLFSHLEHFKRETKLVLLTGEEIDISYCDIMGFFMRIGEDITSRSATPVGLPAKNMPDHMAVPISILNSKPSQKELVFY